MLPVLPLDTSSFKDIRTKGKVYVDKTPWIYKMLTQGKCYFLSRPRRFGKSLTVNTLKELFYGNKELFKGLWIYDKWDFKPHPVIVFDFNTISHSNPEELRRSLLFHMELQAEEHGITLKGEDPKDAFDYLITSLYNKYKKGVVILIDEYDKPILDHLGFGEERLKIAKENRDLLKSFFGVLKGAGTVDELEFVFVTGITTFSKVSMFSEWNNLVNISFDEEFADFPGYTEEEILNNFREHLKYFCEKNGIESVERCMEEIKYWYNGYRFCPYSETRIYNPVSVMTALSKGRFGNYWFETGTPSFLVRLLKERFHEVPLLEHFEVELDTFKAFDLEHLPVEVILYQAGYLTIKEFDEFTEEVILSYPNEEVRKSFCKALFWQGLEVPLSQRAVATRLAKALWKEKFSEVKDLLNEILAEIPYTLFVKADERLFHVIFYLLLNILGVYTQAELLTHRGRLDMMVRYPDKIFIFEFKAGAPAEKAIAQIKEKGYHERFLKEGKPIYLFGISFDPGERKVKEVKWERVILPKVLF